MSTTRVSIFVLFLFTDAPWYTLHVKFSATPSAEAGNSTVCQTHGMCLQMHPGKACCAAVAMTFLLMQDCTCKDTLHDRHTQDEAAPWPG